MRASTDRIRRSMAVEPTAQDKGLVLTLRVVAYDNGMVEVDGIPINVGPPYEAAYGWLGAADVLVGTLAEFRRQAAKRARGKHR